MDEVLTQAGFYNVYLPGSADTTSVGVNYDRNESDLQYWTLEELKQNNSLKNATWLDEDLRLNGGLHPLQAGFPLWKVCLILALLFLALEILLIRLR